MRFFQRARERERLRELGGNESIENICPCQLEEMAQSSGKLALIQIV
jgi:hypothetical protein